MFVGELSHCHDVRPLGCGRLTRPTGPFFVPPALWSIDGLDKQLTQLGLFELGPMFGLRREPPARVAFQRLEADPTLVKLAQISLGGAARARLSGRDRPSTPELPFGIAELAHLDNSFACGARLGVVIAHAMCFHGILALSLALVDATAQRDGLFSRYGCGEQ